MLYINTFICINHINFKEIQLIKLNITFLYGSFTYISFKIIKIDYFKLLIIHFKLF